MPATCPIEGTRVEGPYVLTVTLQVDLVLYIIANELYALVCELQNHTQA